MAKIYILGSKEHTTWAGGIGNIIPIQVMTANEFEKIHDFVVHNFATASKEDAVVIDLDAVSESAVALSIALHIRLSISDICQAVLMPIVFVSSLPLQSFLRLGECSQIFLTLSGIAFCQPEMVRDAVEALEGLSPETYKSDFLDQIQIHPDAETGFHSMANQWGADVFNRIISESDDKVCPEIDKDKNKLYFKYVYANTVNLNDVFNYVKPKSQGVNQTIDASGKNILLIDDEADRGWSTVLKKWLFKRKKFDVINQEIGCYEDIDANIKTKIESDFYDLYFLDLRLLGPKEDDIYSAEDFSGMKVLKAIKEKNRGNQVIMFTASNKAWNMKALLDAGTDGYYIKESPELKLPLKFSIANFEALKHNVKEALNSGYKKVIYREIRELLSNIQGSNIDDVTKNELGYVLQQSSKQVLSAKNSLDFAYAYMTLFQAFEFITKEYIHESEDGKKWIVNDMIELCTYRKKKRWVNPTEYTEYYVRGNSILKEEGNNGSNNDDTNSNDQTKSSKRNNSPTLFQKMMAICMEIAHITDVIFISRMGTCIERRNVFIHNVANKYYEPENRKIDTSEGFSDLLDVLTKIITSII